MAKEKEKPTETPAPAAATDGGAPAATDGGAAAAADSGAAVEQQRPEIKIDDSNASVGYANFCRVTGTPEELIVDFALNSQPVGTAPTAMKVHQRIIVNYFTAKRLLAALHMSVQRHEAAFGVLETDIQKRLLPGAMRAAPPQQPAS